MTLNKRCRYIPSILCNKIYINVEHFQMNYGEMLAFELYAVFWRCTYMSQGGFKNRFWLILYIIWLAHCFFLSQDGVSSWEDAHQLVHLPALQVPQGKFVTRIHPKPLVLSCIHSCSIRQQNHTLGFRCRLLCSLTESTETEVSAVCEIENKVCFLWFYMRGNN